LDSRVWFESSLFRMSLGSGVARKELASDSPEYIHVRRIAATAGSDLLILYRANTTTEEDFYMRWHPNWQQEDMNTLLGLSYCRGQIKTDASTPVEGCGGNRVGAWNNHSFREYKDMYVECRVLSSDYCWAFIGAPKTEDGQIAGNFSASGGGPFSSHFISDLDVYQKLMKDVCEYLPMSPLPRKHGHLEAIVAPLEYSPFKLGRMPGTGFWQWCLDEVGCPLTQLNSNCLLVRNMAIQAGSASGSSPCYRMTVKPHGGERTHFSIC